MESQRYSLKRAPARITFISATADFSGETCCCCCISYNNRQLNGGAVAIDTSSCMWQSVQPSGLGSSGGDKAASAGTCRNNCHHHPWNEYIIISRLGDASHKTCLFCTGFSFSDPASSMMGSFSGGVPPSSDRGSVIMETSSSWSSPHHLLASSAAAFTDSNLYARAPANVYVVSTSTAATPFHGFGSIAASAQAPSMPFGFSFGSASNTLGSAHADPLSFTPDAALNKTLSYTSPGNVIAGKLNPPAADDICCVCQDAIQANETAGLVSCCKQVFHCHCINAALAHSSKCPLCKTIMDYPSGSSCVVSTMPSGTMTISLDPSMTCHGHTPGTIIIKYSIPSGVQKMCHRYDQLLSLPSVITVRRTM